MIQNELEKKGSSSRAKAFLMLKTRPNVHAGLHYPEIMELYGTTNNCSTLQFEDTHRYDQIKA
jgi:hypothetical protein